MSDINEKKDEKEYLKKVLADLAISDDTDVADDIYADNDGCFGIVGLLIWLSLFFGFVVRFKNHIPLYSNPSGPEEYFINFMGLTEYSDLWVFVLAVFLLSIWLYLLSRPFDVDGPWRNIQRWSWIFLKIMLNIRIPVRGVWLDTNMYDTTYAEYCENKNYVRFRLVKAVSLAFCYVFFAFWIFYPRQYIPIDMSKGPVRLECVIVDKYKFRTRRSSDTARIVRLSIKGKVCRMNLDGYSDEWLYDDCRIGDTLELTITSVDMDVISGRNFVLKSQKEPEPLGPENVVDDKLAEEHDPMGCDWTKWADLTFNDIRAGNGMLMTDGTRMDSIPQFPCGERGLTLFFRKRMYRYGEDAHRSTGHSSEYEEIDCVVRSDGRIEYVKCPEFVYNYGPIIKRMPKWAPCYVDGRPVDVDITIRVYSCSHYPVVAKVDVRQCTREIEEAQPKLNR